MAELEKKEILIVEDDEAIRELMALLLEPTGHPIRTLENGLAAMESLCGTIDRVGLICLDLRMPVMDGYTFIEKFREKYGHRVPILVISALDDFDRRREEIQSEGWLPKPFDYEELMQVVPRLLQGGPTNPMNPSH